jgi:hypothetical protein
MAGMGYTLGIARLLNFGTVLALEADESTFGA